MRTLLAALLTWFVPSTGRHHVPAPAPAEAPQRRAVHRQAVRHIEIDGDAIPIVRPYVLRAERQQRWAA